MHVSGVLKELLKYIRLEAFVNNDAWILEHLIGKHYLLREHLIGLARRVLYLFGTQMFAQKFKLYGMIL